MLDARDRRTLELVETISQDSYKGEILKEVLKLFQCVAKSYSLERLTGMTNNTYKITIFTSSSDKTGVPYVIRINGEGTDEFVNRENEMLVLMRSKLDLIAISTKYVVMKYYRDYYNPYKNILSKVACDVVKAIVDYHEYYADMIEFDPELTKCEFNVPNLVKLYEDLARSAMNTIEKDNPNLFEMIMNDHSSAILNPDIVDDYVNELAEDYKKLPIAFSHNDLVLNNIMLPSKDGEPMLIDYEYAGMNTYVWDYASLLLEAYDYKKYPSDSKALVNALKRTAIYSTMEIMDPDNCDIDELSLCMRLQDYIWSLWTIQRLANIKGKQDQYDYFCYFVHRASRFLGGMKS